MTTHSPRMAAESSVIVAGARTPFGRLLGALSEFSAAELGALAIRAALERAGVGADQVDYVIMGQVLTAGAGQIPARQAATAAGIPWSTPALTINKVCLSGLHAIALADQMIRAGEFDIVVAGGQESMSKAPHLVRDVRRGIKFGATGLEDHMALDGLTCAFDKVSMGHTVERDNARHSVTRSDQDAVAVRSHRLAARASEAGVLAEEIVPIVAPGRDGGRIVEMDEGIRPETSIEALGRLRPAFSDDPDATVTAGSSSQISDGACAMVVMRRSLAEELGLDSLAQIGAQGTVSGPDNGLHLQPSNAIAKACAREGIEPAGLDLVEINEAFAAVSLASARALDLDPERVNVNGGALALGHPIGASGARLALALALELQRRGGGTGAAALCGGGGQGDALLLHVPERK